MELRGIVSRSATRERKELVSGRAGERAGLIKICETTLDAFVDRVRAGLSRDSYSHLMRKYTEGTGASDGQKQEIESLQIKTIMRGATRDNEQSFSITLHSHLLESRGDSIPAFFFISSAVKYASRMHRAQRGRAVVAIVLPVDKRAIFLSISIPIETADSNRARRLAYPAAMTSSSIRTNLFPRSEWLCTVIKLQK